MKLQWFMFNIHSKGHKKLQITVGLKFTNNPKMFCLEDFLLVL